MAAIFLFNLFALFILPACPFGDRANKDKPPSTLRTVDANNPVIVIGAKDPIGEGQDVFVTAWEQATNTQPDVRAYTSQYIFGYGWFDTRPVDDNGDGQVTLLRVAGHAEGSDFAVWYKITPQGNRIYANRMANLNIGSEWETPQSLTDSVTVLDLAVAADAHGRSIVIWVQADSPFNRIYARRYTPGIGWDTAQTIDDNTGNSELPRIVMDASGNAIAVWQHDTASSTNIYANYFSTTAGWDIARLISSIGVNASNPDVAMNSAGTAMTVWQQDDGGTSNAYARRFTPNAGWESAQLIESGSSNVVSVHVAIDNTGSAVVVWKQTAIYFNRFTPDTGWGAEQVVALGLVDNPRIATNLAGKTIVSWNQQNPSSQFPDDVLIYSRKFDPLIGWDTSRNLMSEQGSANPPSAAIDSKGNVTVIWSQSVVSNATNTTTAVVTYSY